MNPCVSGFVKAFLSAPDPKIFFDEIGKIVILEDFWRKNY